MRARSFFYVCAGLFLLVAAYTMGARQASADFQLSLPPVIAFSQPDSRVLGRDGSLWGLGTGPDGYAHWVPETAPMLLPAIPPSVSPDDVLFWTPRWTITKDGHGWAMGGPRGWTDAGVLPVAPVSSDTRSWSGVKGGFRK